jgi:hypothetical protein
MAGKSKRVMKSSPTGNRRVSAGPIENVGLQNTMRNQRNDSAKLKNQPVPPPIPPQPFAPPVGKPNPV